jgi:hypothetical protein
MKTLFRTDTWAQIEERKLTSDELQAELDFGGPAQEEHPPGCPKCDGDGEYYEDGIEDGGRQVYCDCPAGVALKEKDKTIIVESKSICATCLGDCKPEEQDPEILNGLTYCADFRDAPSPKQEAARDYTCNDWRECNHAFKCFGPANDDSGLCFKQIEEAREADQEEPAEICTHCNGSGEREENGRMVYCDWCPAGDALQEKELLEAKAKAPEPTGSRCPLCDFVGYSKAELIKHVRATHKTSLKEAMDAASKALPNVDHDNDGWPDPPTAGAAA